MITIEILRQYKIGPFAIFDTAISYVAALILTPLLSWIFSKMHVKTPWYSWLWLTLPVAVVFHLLFRQQTPLMKILGDPTQISFYSVILLLLTMSYMGVKDWKKK